MATRSRRDVQLILVSICLGLAALPGCGGTDKGGQVRPQRDPNLAVDARLVEATNDFGFRLYRELRKADSAENIFVSPTSIELALAMTYNGAGGTTKDAMAAALGFDTMTLDEVNQANAELLTLLRNPDPLVEVAIANSLWCRQGTAFNAGFLQRNTDYYAAEVRTINFALPGSADTINRWVDVETRGMIPRIVTADDIRDALLLLINALYFKGQWTIIFEEDETQNGPFTLLDGTQKTLPMMHLTAGLEYLETDEFQAVSLPYGDEYVRMVVFLPKADTTLADFTAMLTHDDWERWLGQFQGRNVALALPRFKAGYFARLKDALSALGMGVAFTPGADFWGMLAPLDPGKPPPPMHAEIKDALHKTALRVNEEGTQAAAATVVIVVPPGAEPTGPPTMTVDHPFFVVIEDRPTGAILFMGSIVDPEPMT